MYLTHRTIQGERWDQIAYRYYGDALGYERIIVANPDAPIVPVLPGGVVLLIPVIEPTRQSPLGMPPWK